MLTNLYRRARRPVNPPAARPPRRRFRPEVLPLEERAVPSVTLMNEVEGNNTAAQATPLPTSGGLVIASGAIGAPGDVDYYSFSAPGGYQVWAYVDTGGSPNPGATSSWAKLSLVKSDGTVLEQDFGDGTGTGGDTTIENTDSAVIANKAIPSGGTYYLRV